VRHGTGRLQAGGRAGSLVIDARQQTQQAGEFASVPVEPVVGLECVDQAGFADFSVAFDMLVAQVGGGIGDFFAALAGGHHAQMLQFFERVIDQVSSTFMMKQMSARRLSRARWVTWCSTSTSSGIKSFRPAALMQCTIQR